MDISRQLPPDPYSLMPARPSFTLTSTDFVHGAALPFAQSVPGGSVSPQLAWSGFPAATKSFALSCFDPDAPGVAGWWHWTILDLPLECTELPAGAGESDLNLEGAAFHLRNDCNTHDFTGAAPPAGDYQHRYYFVVHALDVDTLNLDEDTPPGAAACALSFHTLARAILMGTYQNPPA